MISPMHHLQTYGFYVKQAHVPFAEDDLPTVGLEASPEGNTEKGSCRGSCALPGVQMVTDRTFLQNIMFQCSL